MERKERIRTLGTLRSSQLSFYNSKRSVRFYFRNFYGGIRDWSLITGRGGATKQENCGSETFCAPPSRQGKTFCAPLLKGGNFLRPPITMAKTSKLPC